MSGCQSWENIKAPGGAGASAYEQHQRSAGLAPFLFEKEHQAQLWQLLPPLKTCSLFLSDICKKKVYQQSLKFKSCLCTLHSQSFPEPARVSRQNPRTMIRFYSMPLSHFVTQLPRHNCPHPKLPNHHRRSEEWSLRYSPNSHSSQLFILPS